MVNFDLSDGSVDFAGPFNVAVTYSIVIHVPFSGPLVSPASMPGGGNLGSDDMVTFSTSAGGYANVTTVSSAVSTVTWKAANSSPSRYLTLSVYRSAVSVTGRVAVGGVGYTPVFIAGTLWSGAGAGTGLPSIDMSGLL